jgi:hypothetical protein
MKVSFKFQATVVWCGVVWCGVVWCGVVWCGQDEMASIFIIFKMRKCRKYQLKY